MPKHSTPVQRVEYGLDTVSPDRLVAVSLQDLMYVHQTIGELVRFFHQPLHYPNLKAVERFIGACGSGDAFDLLGESYYERTRAMIPLDIDEAFGEGVLFDHPLPPSYYEPNVESSDQPVAAASGSVVNFT